MSDWSKILFILTLSLIFAKIPVILNHTDTLSMEVLSTKLLKYGGLELERFDS